MELYDKETIDQLKWPQTPEGELAKKYLLPMIKEGPETFIANARTKLYVLKVDEFVVPISVNETEYDNSYLLSSYFIVAHWKEQLQKGSPLKRALLKPLVSLLGSLLRWVKINKVVIINNWLMSTNLYPDLNKEQIGKITSFLKTRFPDHYFMFRSVNTYKKPEVYAGLDAHNYRLIKSRHIYLYDPSREVPKSTLRKQVKDVNKVKNANYTLEEVEHLTEAQVERLLKLYNEVYLDKYTKYSPQYTEKYVRLALTSKALSFALLKKQEQIYGVSAFLKKDDFLLVPFFGYDTTLPTDEGIYRMLSSSIISKSKACNLVSHQGSGAATFKKWRGCIEEQEYVAIYDHHLPFLRRAFWSISEKVSK